MKSIECDLDNLNSISVAVEKILNDTPVGVQIQFETNLPLSLRGQRYSDNNVDIWIEGEYENSMISTSETYDGREHRWLSFQEETIKPFKSGKVAHELFKFIKAVEEATNGEFCKEESVKGLGLVLFWIREGYMPESRILNNASKPYSEPVFGEEMLKVLTEELLGFMHNRKRLGARKYIVTRSDYMTKLVYNPTAAAAYWKELKRLSGYREGGE